MGDVLAECRAEIDRIDSQLLDLLARRMECSLRIGAAKKSAGLPVYDSGRESQLLAALAAQARPPLAPAAVAEIWAPILAASRALQ